MQRGREKQQREKRRYIAKSPPSFWWEGKIKGERSRNVRSES